MKSNPNKFSRLLNTKVHFTFCYFTFCYFKFHKQTTFEKLSLKSYMLPGLVLILKILQ